MKQIQRGFTLIELVMVIVILGILAAVALPKFVDLSSQAGDAATKGVAGAIASASSINYASRAAGSTPTTTLGGTNAATCDKDVIGALVSGIAFTNGTSNTADSNTYNISGGASTPTTCVSNPGVATTCTVIGSKGSAYQAVVICTGA